VRRVALVAIMAACSSDAARTLPPQGQILLYFDTDAPLPDGAPGAPSPLFDRLRVTLVPPLGAPPCEQCTQDFEPTTPLFASRTASVGLAPPPGQAGWLAHVQMFPLQFAVVTGLDTDDPADETTIDVLVALPPIDPTGVVELTVMLSTETVGQPAGTAAVPVQPSPGPPASSRVGSWAPTIRVGCSGSPLDGEVCVPGGAYWMGATGVANPADSEIANLFPRLVTLSPFYLQATEVTVAQYRRFGSVGQTWTGNSLGTSTYDWCTFTAEPGPFEDHPVNCLEWQEARSYCQSRGGDLPTEAQWEYAASGLSGTTFVWGTDLPGCGDAVFGQGGDVLPFFPYSCPSASPGQAPVPLGDAGRGLDALSLDGGTIYDLAGNLFEWTLDTFESPVGPCWVSSRVYSDPACGAPGFTGDHALRGGSWELLASYLRATSRLQTAPVSIDPGVGVRCARPGR